MEELSEKQIQDAIFDFLIRSRFVVMRINQGAAYMQNERGPKRFVRFVIWAVLGIPKSSKGIADLYCLSPKGKTYAFEVKDAHGKATRDQKFFLQQVRDRGGVGMVVRSLDEVVEIVNEELGHVLF